MDDRLGKREHHLLRHHSPHVPNRHLTVQIPGATDRLPRTLQRPLQLRLRPPRGRRSRGHLLRQDTLQRHLHHPGRAREHVVHRRVPHTLLLWHGELDMVGDIDARVLPSVRSQVGSRGDTAPEQLLSPSRLGNTVDKDYNSTDAASGGRGRADRAVLCREPGLHGSRNPSHCPAPRLSRRRRVIRTRRFYGDVPHSKRSQG